MKIIVTGGEGFIGKALVTAFLKRGHDVITFDRKNGVDVAEEFLDIDLSRIDCVYHLAAQTSVFNEDKAQIIHDNITAFQIVCDACKRYGVRFIYASSSTANPCNTTSLYGISNQFDEQYARCYYPEATGVRFHNVYGPNPRHGTLLWHLLNDRRVSLFNQGKNYRHFTYIDDIVSGLILAYSEPDALLNIANPERLSTFQFASIVSGYNGVEIERVGDLRELDRKFQIVDSEIRTLSLQYTSASEGIRKVFESIEDGKKAE